MTRRNHPEDRELRAPLIPSPPPPDAIQSDIPLMFKAILLGCTIDVGRFSNRSNHRGRGDLLVSRREQLIN